MRTIIVESIVFDVAEKQIKFSGVECPRYVQCADVIGKEDLKATLLKHNENILLSIENPTTELRVIIGRPKLLKDIFDLLETKYEATVDRTALEESLVELKEKRGRVMTVKVEIKDPATLMRFCAYEMRLVDSVDSIVAEVGETKAEADCMDLFPMDFDIMSLNDDDANRLLFISKKEPNNIVVALFDAACDYADVMNKVGELGFAEAPTTNFHDDILAKAFGFSTDVVR